MEGEKHLAKNSGPALRSISLDSHFRWWRTCNFKKAFKDFRPLPCKCWAKVNIYCWEYCQVNYQTIKRDAALNNLQKYFLKCTLLIPSFWRYDYRSSFLQRYLSEMKDFMIIKCWRKKANEFVLNNADYVCEFLFIVIVACKNYRKPKTNKMFTMLKAIKRLRLSPCDF